MAVRRLKNKWHRPDGIQWTAKSMQSHATALAFIAWSSALDTARKLHGEDYHYESDHQRIGVVTELIAFAVHLCDRFCYERLSDESRTTLINALGERLAGHMQENLEDIAGPGNYRPPFVALLNQRLADYAETRFVDGEPGYDLLRYLGRSVLDVMGETQTNRWVMDQIMSIEAPLIVDRLRASFDNLLDTG